ncbi:PAAR domain-containing protein [Thauera propionica]|uniref:PAAR domain-containing protein n=1 Tax=Thauera propionica TaxID=2019431 RepID=UPI0023F45F24|nr:PAAR domain-containing protein [Thauera propionica]MDD3675231.1 PAAR domain-containing protein [Thauera propionica]
MPAVTRLGDLCTGHGCYPPRPSISAASTVYVNGLPAHRVSDAWAAHGCARCPAHGGTLARGSSTVFAEGRAIGRIGDPVDCGSYVAHGSPNVFAG